MQERIQIRSREVNKRNKSFDGVERERERERKQIEMKRITIYLHFARCAQNDNGTQQHCLEMG